MRLLLVAAVVVMVIAAVSGKRPRQDRRQVQLRRHACKLVKADGTEVSSSACAQGKLCNQGPLPVSLTDGTTGKATYCQGAKPRLRNFAGLPRGTCKMMKAGETAPVFQWGCRADAACDCGPTTTQHDGSEVQAFRCRKPRGSTGAVCPRQGAAGGAGGRRPQRQGDRAARRQARIERRQQRQQRRQRRQQQQQQ